MDTTPGGVIVAGSLTCDRLWYFTYHHHLVAAHSELMPLIPTTKVILQVWQLLCCSSFTPFVIRLL